MSKILVTGGAGFVGRHCIKYLLEKGHKVFCVDNLVKYTGAINPKDGWMDYSPFDFDSFVFFKQDCRDFFKDNKDTDFDYVFHLAAIVGGRLMIENNPLSVADDLSIDSELWQWVSETRPKKTICFSSSAAYPIKYQTEHNYKLLKESLIRFNSSIGLPDMSYGWAKLTHEYLAKLAYEKNGISSVVYRPFSGYGSDQDMSYPFPSICKRVLKNIGAKTVNVWGNGLQMRDFIHIDDCVEGIISTMDKINDGSALNLSTGIYTNFIELASSASDIVGYKPLVKGLSNKPSGVFARAGDVSKQKQFGFNYKISLRQGLKKCLNYLDGIL